MTQAWLDGTVLILADSHLDAQIIRDGLPESQEIITLSSVDLIKLQREILHYKPHLVCVSVQSVKSDLISDIETLLRRNPVPLILFAVKDSENFAEQSVRIGISAFVIDGLESARIAPVAKVAVERFRLNGALQAELQKSREDLRARKLIDKAKALLMQAKNMTEQEAYGTLRSMAMRQGKPMKHVAETVISLSDLLP